MWGIKPFMKIFLTFYWLWGLYWYPLSYSDNGILCVSFSCFFLTFFKKTAFSFTDFSILVFFFLCNWLISVLFYLSSYFGLNLLFLSVFLRKDFRALIRDHYPAVQAFSAWNFFLSTALGASRKFGCFMYLYLVISVPNIF